MAFLITDVGKQDTTIDWTTQGKPWWLALNSARVGFAGVAIGNQGHSWMGFLGVIENLHSLFGLQFEDIAPWRYPLDLSFISITNASDSGNPVQLTLATTLTISQSYGQHLGLILIK